MDTQLMIPPKRYSLIAFFFLAFAIAWGFWIPAALALKGFLSLPFPVTLAELLGVWGPSLAGIVMTAVNLVMLIVVMSAVSHTSQTHFKIERQG